MPIMNEESVRFNTKCPTCGRAFSSVNYDHYETLKTDIVKAGWVQVYDRYVCPGDAEAVRLWRDGPLKKPKLVLKKRRRRG